MSKSFNQDPNGLQSFMRPVNEMNRPSGLKYFCLNSQLNEFIIREENCLFIKTQIDTSNILNIDY